MKQQDIPSGIILDEPYTNGLLVKALETGYARITFPSDYTSNVLRKARNPVVGQRALEMLLLYDKAYVTSWFDNTDVEQLTELGLLGFVNSEWIERTVDEDYARSIAALLLADLHRKGTRLTQDKFDELLPYVNAMYTGNITILAEQLMPSIRRMFGSPSESSKRDNEPSLTEMFREEVEIARKHSPADFETAQKIQDSHHHLRNLLEASAHLNMPVFSNLRRVPNLRVGIEARSFDPNARLALSIYMNESLSIPRVQSLEDVLRLRNDSRIKHFRMKIFEWCEKLRTGAVGSEETMRAEIRDANAAIEDIEKYKKIGMWITFLSVPLSVAELLI